MIPLFKVRCPKRGNRLVKKINDVFKSGMITEGKYSDEFEQMLSDYIGNPNSVLVNSCTSALTLAYRLAGVTQGSEIIVTPLTCMATNEPAFNMGAKLVFADIDPLTGNIDPESVKKKITSKTKAISAVHWAGQPFDISEINYIARQHGIKVIEDAAHAFGASYKGKRIGAPPKFHHTDSSDYICFSFQAIKHLTTGDGGLLACKKTVDAERAKKLRWFGLDRKYKGNKWNQDITECGYKFHMNNIVASIGIQQMKDINFIVRSHMRNGLYYDKFIDNPRVQKLKRSASSKSSYWIYSLLVDDKESFREYLNSNGIACDEVHVRNDKYSVFSAFKKEELPGVDEFEKRMLNIPVGWWVKEYTAKRIVDVINKYENS